MLQLQRLRAVIYSVVLPTVVLQLPLTKAIRSLESVPASDGGVLTAGVGQQIVLTCSHDNNASISTGWKISAPVGCTGAVNPVFNILVDCGPFSLASISDVFPYTTNATATATTSMTDAVVQCLDGTEASATQVGSNIALCIYDSPTFFGLRQDNPQTTLNSAVVVWTPPSKCPGDNVTFTVTVLDENGVEVYSHLSATNSSSMPITGLVPNSMYNVRVIAENSRGATFQQAIPVVIQAKVLPPTSVSAAITCSTSQPSVDIQWELNSILTSSTSLGFTLHPTPDFVYINYTSSNGERNFTEVSYPVTSASLLLTRGANYTIVASSVRMGVSESETNPTDYVYVEYYFIDNRTLSTNDCITVILNRDCTESVSLFTPQLSYGLCTNQTDTYRNQFTSSFDSTSFSTCLMITNIPLGQICYEVSLSYNGLLIDGSAQTGMYSLRGCMTSQLDTFSGSMVTFNPDRSESSPGVLPHSTSVVFSCSCCITLKGPSMSICDDGSWNNPVQRSCPDTVTSTTTAVVITFVVTAVTMLFLGVVSGSLVTLCIIKKRKSITVTEHQSPTDGASGGPFYEQVSHAIPSSKEELKMDENVAYGHVQQHH